MLSVLVFIVRLQQYANSNSGSVNRAFATQATVSQTLMPLRMDPDALAVSSTGLRSRGAYDMYSKSKLHVATFSWAHHFTWWFDHAAHHALVIPDYSNLMYEPRESRWNLNLTSEYDICREALPAHVYGLPVRSKVIQAGRLECSDAMPSRAYNR